MANRVGVVVQILISLGSVLFAEPGARYLIIAHDDFYDAVQPLAEWKNKKGVSCIVKRKSEIGNTATVVREYIINAYNTWEPRPEFILLVGSGAHISAFYRGSGSQRYYMDSKYGDVIGDTLADLPYGRLPCKTARQCSVMVARIVNYERYPFVEDTLWLRRATTIVNDSADDDGWRYWADARFVAGLAEANGFAGIDSLSSLRHHRASDILKSVEQGASFVLYRGTATNDWRAPFEIRFYLPNLDNGSCTPIVCSFTCQTMSLASTQDSMTGNTWVKLGTPELPRGAVAFVGNTHSGVNVANRRSAMTRGFFTRLFSDSLPYLGHALLVGKLQLLTETGDWRDYFGFNMFGDPEMNVWTTMPVPMELTFDSLLPIGDDTFRIFVSRRGLPLQNALVCVRNQADSVYQWGYTDEKGELALTFTTTQEESLELTVTGKNCLPYEGYVQVGTVSQVIEAQQFERQDDGRIQVIPNPSHGQFAVKAPIGSEISILSASGRTLCRYLQGRTLDAGCQNLLFSGSSSVLACGVYHLVVRSPDGRIARQRLVVAR
ncbi:MAG: C25 family cysteine peptidase [candidate division WOR-3 bacterium]